MLADARVRMRLRVCTSDDELIRVVFVFVRLLPAPAGTVQSRLAPGTDATSAEHHSALAWARSRRLNSASTSRARLGDGFDVVDCHGRCALRHVRARCVCVCVCMCVRVRVCVGRVLARLAGQYSMYV